MDKGIKILMDNKKNIHLRPNFRTYLSGNITGTPEWILSNNKIYHNQTIDQFAITSPDYIPILLTLTTRAVRTTTAPKYQYNKTDWDVFKEEIKTKQINTQIENLMTHLELQRNFSIYVITIEDIIKNIFLAQSYNTKNNNE